MTLDERCLARAMHAAVADPVVPDGLASRVVAAHGRRRRRRAALGGVAAVLAVVAALAVPAAVRRAAPPVTEPLTEGVMVAANGALISRPGEPVRFCEVRYRTDDMRSAGFPPGCWNEVDAVGATFEGLTRRTGQLGDVRWADLWLRGYYRDGRLHVVEQAPEWRFAESRHANPCPAAPGTAGIDSTGAAHWSLRHPGEVTGTTLLNVGGDRGILIVGAVHPEVVEAGLRPAYGDALCVVQARWTAAQVAAARADARAFVHERALGKPLADVHDQLDVDEEFETDGQVHVDVHVLTADAATAALAARHPAGLLRIEPWLAPVS